jgi:hypothetical protein
MREKKSFRPSLSGLERRLVPSHGPSTYSVLTGNDQGKAFVLSHTKPTPIVTLVNAAFAQFNQDYSQTRAVYFGAIANQTATANDTVAFNHFTVDRVNLLAQQLANSFLQTPQSTTRGHHLPSPLTVLGKRINGLSTTSTPNPFAVGTLGNALIASVPAPNASATTIALDSAAQNNAIQTAQVAMINNINIIKNGDFGYNVKPHK